MMFTPALLIVCVALMSRLASAEFGRPAVRQSGRDKAIADTEILFRVLAEDDGLLFFSMSMSMSISMSMPIIPTSAPVRPVDVSVAPVSLAPVSSAPSSASSVPSKAPSSPTTVGSMENITSALVSDVNSASVSGSPGSTPFVSMGCAGGIVVLAAALAIRRSRKWVDLNDFKKDEATVDDDEERSFGGVERSLAVVAGSTTKMAV